MLELISEHSEKGATKSGIVPFNVIVIVINLNRFVLCGIVVLFHFASCSPFSHRLVGLVVKASASRAEGPGFESRLRRDYFGVESYQ